MGNVNIADRCIKIYDDYGDYKKKLKEKKANIAQLNKKDITLLFSLDLLEAINLYLIPFFENGKIGFMNKMAKVVIDSRYDEIKGAFIKEDDFVAVRIGNKWSAIDSKGKELLPFDYSLIFTSPDSSLAACCKSYWSVIDLNTLSVFVKEKTYELIEGFRYGYARVKNNNKWGIINTQGELVLDTRYYSIYPWFEWKEATTILKETADSKEVIKWLNDL